MPRKCNINRRGRIRRLATGIVLTMSSIILIYINATMTALELLVLAAGLFSIAEAVFGWCVLVATLEKVKAGVTRNRMLREVLDSST